MLLFLLITVLSLTGVTAAPLREVESEATGTGSLPVGLIIGIVASVVALVGLTLPACANWCHDGLMGVKDDAASTYSGMEPPVRSTPGTPGMPRGATPDYNAVVDIEPLPDLGPRQPKPAHFNHAVNRGISSQDWQNNPKAADLSRAQLQFVQEVGKGWFGRAVDARDRVTGEPCVVKVLRDDATSMEKAFFLYEARGYRDLSCRNCLIDQVGFVRIGDYGVSAEKYKEDYHSMGDSYVPLRWWAPESFLVEGRNLTTRPLTKEANVWSFGVLLWEVLEFAKLPYMNLNDKEVIEQVIRPRICLLGPSSTPVAHQARLVELLGRCWSPDPSTRPTMAQVAAMLAHLDSNRAVLTPDADFESKWNSFNAMGGRPHDDTTPVPPDPVVSVHQMAHVHSAAATPRDESVAVPIEPHLTEAGKDEEIKAKERQEKRSFILSLSEADLANLSTSELVDFYEYLSPDEITGLEARHRAVLLKAADERSKATKREQFLAMSLEEMDALGQDQLRDYLDTLSPTEQSTVEAKLKERAAARDRLLGLGSDDLLALSDADRCKARDLLTPDELEHLEARIAQAKDRAQRAAAAKNLLMLDDAALARLSDSEIADASTYLQPDVQSQLRNRRAEIRTRQQYILGCTGDALLEMDEATLHGYLQVLSDSQAADIESRLQQAASSRRDIDDRRRRILDSQGSELLVMSREPDFQENLNLLSTPEREKVLSIIASLEREEKEQADERERAREQQEQAQVPEPHVMQEAAFTSQSAAPPERELDFGEPETEPRVFYGEPPPDLSHLPHADPKRQAVKDELLSASGYRLIELYETVDPGVRDELTNEEQANVEMRLEHAQNRRAEILDLTPVQLSTMAIDDSVDFERYLSPEEWVDFMERVEDAINTRNELREYILTCEDVELFALSQTGLGAYEPYLTEEELMQLDQRIADFGKMRKEILAADDPTDFGEEFVRKYLTPEEAEKLVVAKDASSDEGEIRSEILNAEGMDLFKLYRDKWDLYFPYLTMEERAGIVNWVNQISVQRERFLNATDENLAKVPPEQMEGAEKYFSPEEYADIRERWESLQGEKARLRHRVLTIPDSELFDFVKTSDYDKVLPFLNHDEVQTINHRVSSIESKRQRLLNSTDSELLDLPPDELQDMLNSLPEEIRESLLRKVETLRLERNKKRDRASSLTPLDLAQLSDSEFSNYKAAVTPTAWDMMQRKRQNAKKSREEILKLMESGKLVGYTEKDVRCYSEYLTEQERGELLENVRRLSIKTPAEITTPNDASTPYDEREAPPTPRLPEQILREGATLPGLANLSGREDFEEKRSLILSASDADLLNTPLQSIEEFYDYLAPNEIWELQERLSKLQSLPEADFSEDESAKAPLSRASGLGSSFGDVSKLSLKPEHSSMFETPWEAREHILQMNGDDLWNNSGNLDDYYLYLTVAEQKQLEKRLSNVQAQKRTDILHASNDELKSYTPTQLQKYMGCLSAYEQATVKDRLGHLDQLSVVSDSDVDIELSKNPDAFKKYLAMTAEVSFSSASMDNTSDTNMAGEKQSFGKSLAEELGDSAEREAVYYNRDVEAEEIDRDNQATPTGWLSEDSTASASTTRGRPVEVPEVKSTPLSNEDLQDLNDLLKMDQTTRQDEGEREKVASMTYMTPVTDESEVDLDGKGKPGGDVIPEPVEAHRLYDLTGSLPPPETVEQIRHVDPSSDFVGLEQRNHTLQSSASQRESASQWEKSDSFVYQDSDGDLLSKGMDHISGDGWPYTQPARFDAYEQQAHHEPTAAHETITQSATDDDDEWLRVQSVPETFDDHFHKDPTTAYDAVQSFGADQWTAPLATSQSSRKQLHDAATGAHEVTTGEGDNDTWLDFQPVPEVSHENAHHEPTADLEIDRSQADYRWLAAQPTPDSLHEQHHHEPTAAMHVLPRTSTDDDWLAAQSTHDVSHDHFHREPTAENENLRTETEDYWLTSQAVPEIAGEHLHNDPTTAYESAKFLADEQLLATQPEPDSWHDRFHHDPTSEHEIVHTEADDYWLAAQSAPGASYDQAHHEPTAEHEIIRAVDDGQWLAAQPAPNASYDQAHHEPTADHEIIRAVNDGQWLAAQPAPVASYDQAHHEPTAEHEMVRAVDDGQWLAAQPAPVASYDQAHHEPTAEHEMVRAVDDGQWLAAQPAPDASYDQAHHEPTAEHEMVRAVDDGQWLAAQPAPDASYDQAHHEPTAEHEMVRAVDDGQWLAAQPAPDASYDQAHHEPTAEHEMVRAVDDGQWLAAQPAPDASYDQAHHEPTAEHEMVRAVDDGQWLAAQPAPDASYDQAHHEPTAEHEMVRAVDDGQWLAAQPAPDASYDQAHHEPTAEHEMVRAVDDGQWLAAQPAPDASYDQAHHEPTAEHEMVRAVDDGQWLAAQPAPDASYDQAHHEPTAEHEMVRAVDDGQWLAAQPAPEASYDQAHHEPTAEHEMVRALDDGQWLAAQPAPDASYDQAHHEPTAEHEIVRAVDDGQWLAAQPAPDASYDQAHHEPTAEHEMVRAVDDGQWLAAQPAPDASYDQAHHEPTAEHEMVRAVDDGQWLAAQPAPEASYDQAHHEPTAEHEMVRAVDDGQWLAAQPAPDASYDQAHHEPTAEHEIVRAVDDGQWLAAQPAPDAFHDQAHHEPTAEHEIMRVVDDGQWLASQADPGAIYDQLHHEPTIEHEYRAPDTNQEWLAYQPSTPRAHDSSARHGHVQSPGSELQSNILSAEHHDDMFFAQPSAAPDVPWHENVQQVDAVELRHVEPSESAGSMTYLTPRMPPSDLNFDRDAKDEKEIPPPIKSPITYQNENFFEESESINQLQGAPEMQNGWPQDKSDDGWLESQSGGQFVAQELHLNEPSQAVSPSQAVEGSIEKSMQELTSPWTPSEQEHGAEPEVNGQSEHGWADVQKVVDVVSATNAIMSTRGWFHADHDNWNTALPFERPTEIQNVEGVESGRMTYLTPRTPTMELDLSGPGGVETEIPPPIKSPTTGGNVNFFGSEPVVTSDTRADEQGVQAVLNTITAANTILSKRGWFHADHQWNDNKMQAQCSISIPADDVIDTSERVDSSIEQTMLGYTASSPVETNFEVQDQEGVESGQMTYMTPRSPTLQLDLSGSGVETETPPPVKSPTTGNNVDFFGSEPGMNQNDRVPKEDVSTVLKAVSDANTILSQRGWFHADAGGAPWKSHELVLNEPTQSVPASADVVETSINDVMSTFDDGPSSGHGEVQEMKHIEPSESAELTGEMTYLTPRTPTLELDLSGSGGVESQIPPPVKSPTTGDNVEFFGSETALEAEADALGREALDVEHIADELSAELNRDVNENYPVSIDPDRPVSAGLERMAGSLGDMALGEALSVVATDGGGRGMWDSDVTMVDNQGPNVEEQRVVSTATTKTFTSPPLGERGLTDFDDFFADFGKPDGGTGSSTVHWETKRTITNPDGTTTVTQASGDGKSPSEFDPFSDFADLTPTVAHAGMERETGLTETGMIDLVPSYDDDQSTDTDSGMAKQVADLQARFAAVGLHPPQIDFQGSSGHSGSGLESFMTSTPAKKSEDFGFTDSPGNDNSGNFLDRSSSVGTGSAYVTANEEQLEDVQFKSIQDEFDPFATPTK